MTRRADALSELTDAVLSTGCETATQRAVYTPMSLRTRSLRHQGRLRGAPASALAAGSDWTQRALSAA